LGALTSRPYSFTQRPWELYSSLVNPVFDNYGIFFRVDFDRGKVSRVLATRNCNAWISDYMRLIVKNVSDNYFIRRIFSRGTRLNYSLIYFFNVFPNFLYKTFILSNKLQIKFRNFNYFYLLSGPDFISYKLWPCFEINKVGYIFNFLVFNPFRYVLRFCSRRFVYS
jgi:hypothetical protein